MTACINPNGMVSTKLQDPEIRKFQYLEALNFYLNETDCNIVFCENTGTNIYNKIESIKKNTRLEYITFQGNNYDKTIGKAYGESLIIRYAIQHSKFIKKTDYICKITGRVKVLNINEIIYDKVLIRKKDVIKVSFLFYGNINSVCFIAPKNWLLQMMKKKASYFLSGKEIEMESVMYDSIVETPFLKIVTCFPDIKGICASFNSPYIVPSTPQKEFEHYAILGTIYKFRNEKWNYLRVRILWLYYVLVWKLKCDNY